MVGKSKKSKKKGVKKRGKGASSNTSRVTGSKLRVKVARSGTVNQRYKGPFRVVKESFVNTAKSLWKHKVIFLLLIIIQIVFFVGDLHKCLNKPFLQFPGHSFPYKPHR